MKKSLMCKLMLSFILMLSILLSSTGSIFTVYADDEVPKIKLNVSSATIVTGRSFSLKVYNVSKTQIVTFVSADDKTASVSSTGRIKGIANGSTIITVTVYDGDAVVALLSCNVLVGPPAISVKFTKSEIVMAVGMRRITKTLVQPSNTVETVKYFSEDDTVATISSSGRIIAKNPGTTYVYAIIGNGKYDPCKVIVPEIGTTVPPDSEAEPTLSPSPTPTPVLTPAPLPSTTPKVTPSVTPSPFPTGILIDPVTTHKMAF